ncbi:AraC family transcriptional regulator [Amycolatopsis echigonensis]|uniref:AraC family transcriptional regulator n=1 Tax=Amycolatopsis echigonensis TaxID=2576905 RepID=A0A2N3WAU4_9PSEU|nr:AraC family transcriptional regulator [Amycolatopsis niigatensis]PKV90991.1 AraC family transcriptional regulator [Amycolatopsis niigatensis]
MTATPNRPLPGTSPRWSTDVVRTADRDEAQQEISQVFSPHTLEVVGPGQDLDVALRARRTDSITVADIRHGTEVVVRPGRLHSYYEINVPLRGHTLSQCGPDEIESGAGRAAVLTPTEESSMHWSADCAQLAVKVSRHVVERTVEAALGSPPDEAVHFAVGFDLTGSPGRNWLRAVLLLRDAVDSGAPDLVLRPLEELVVGQLLAAQPNNFSDRLLHDAARPARPRMLSRVIDVIDADPAAPHTVADLARIGGTSVRSLQAAFSEHLGLTPTEYLRRVRLARAHQDLQNAAPGDGLSVSDIAFRWGFGHVPRFAAAYRERYGQLPSQTLRT